MIIHIQAPVVRRRVEKLLAALVPRIGGGEGAATIVVTTVGALTEMIVTPVEADRAALEVDVIVVEIAAAAEGEVVVMVTTMETLPAERVREMPAALGNMASNAVRKAFASKVETSPDATNMVVSTDCKVAPG